MRWREYFEKISTEEFEHPPIPHVPPVYGPVPSIAVSEVEAALKRMKSGKATGPDDLAVELWKSRCWKPADWLARFLNRVVAEKKMPAVWQQSITIPVWKKKAARQTGQAIGLYAFCHTL